MGSSGEQFTPYSFTISRISSSVASLNVLSCFIFSGSKGDSVGTLAGVNDSLILAIFSLKYVRKSLASLVSEVEVGRALTGCVLMISLH